MQHEPDVPFRSQVVPHGTLGKTDRLVRRLPFQTEWFLELADPEGVDTHDPFAIGIDEIARLVPLEFVFHTEAKPPGQGAAEYEPGTTDIEPVVRAFRFPVSTIVGLK